jgi:thymidylate kinase
MKDLQIIIAGATGSGKSTMMLLLEKFLVENGFSVEMQMENEALDYGTENRMRQIFLQNFDERLDAMKQNVKITLQQKQTINGSFTQNKNDQTQTKTDNDN